MRHNIASHNHHCESARTSTGRVVIINHIAIVCGTSHNPESFGSDDTFHKVKRSK
jgi:hypothetical protein